MGAEHIHTHTCACECTCVQQPVWGTPVVICALLSDEGIREYDLHRLLSYISSIL